MQVEPSTIPDVELIGPAAAGFKPAVEALLGREPDDELQPALPYSVIAANHRQRAIALLGIRFDMLGRNGKSYSVIHYADTLRHPERSSLTPGGMRFVCAEPLYTDMVLRRAAEIDPRGPMNLDNLRKATQVNASLDCAAFNDGQFAGPDSLGAFERLESEREAEIALIEEVLKPGCGIEELLKNTMEVATLTSQRVLARRFLEAFAGGGVDEAALRARNHRLRKKLSRG